MSLQSLLAAQHPELPGIPEERALRTNRKNDGREFQEEIARTAGAYNSKRVATIKKVDPPVRIIWPFNKHTGKPEQRVIFMENPHVDFEGCWTIHGARMLAIEAKSTSVHRLAFNRDSGGFKASQWAAMKTWRYGGAACALLWKFNGHVVLFTPEMLVVAEGRGDKSLTFEEGIPVERGEGTIVWDFLGTLEKKLWPARE